MSDYSKTDIGSGYNSTTSINTELGKIETAVNSKVDKSGSTMTGNMDMNSNRVLNLPAPVAGTEPVRLADLPASAESTTASLVTYNQGGTGATDTTVQAKLQETVSVKDFGAVGDGVTDDTAAIDAAVTASAGRALYFPEGYTYLYNPTTSIAISVDNTTLYGGGKIKASSAADKLIRVTGNSCTIDGLILEGDGTTTQSQAVANEDRVSLIYITGNDNTVKNCKLIKGHQNFVHLHGCNGNVVSGNTFFGGVPTFTDTAYQGIRCTDVSRTSLVKNKFTLVAGEKTVQAIFLGKFSIAMNDNIVNENNIESCFDHGIYSIASDNSTFNNNVVKSDGSAIVVSGADNTIGSVLGCSIVGNALTVDTPLSSTTPAIYTRDCNNFNVSNNVISGFPAGISSTPVQYNTNNNTLDGNIFSNNKISGCTQNGITMGKGGLTAGSFSNNIFSGNSIEAGAGRTSTSVGISLSIGQVLGANVANSNVINGNIIKGFGNAGVSISNADSVKVSSNQLIDVSEDATGTIRAGIFLSNFNFGEVSDNSIIDTKGTSTTNYGIDGANTCSSVSFNGNTIKNVLSIPIRRTQQSGHTNTHYGNRTGNDNLTGVVTLGAAATTVVSNDNAQQGSGYNVYVKLSPINTAAGSLVGGTKSPTVQVADYVVGTSFTIRTADGTAAAGTEQFFYEIVG